MAEHEIEISEPSFQALHASDLTFQYVARCSCDWHSDPNEDRAKVKKQADKHLKGVKNG